jgi:lipopolysaccharide transport system ATP-binding protein
MYVRLAFAVAAHLDSEILIVDEVLAVGDAEFQRKCLGKMGEVSKNEGRTVLYVSHQMGTVAQLCTKALLLDNGMITMEGKTDAVIEEYNNKFKSKESLYENPTGEADIAIERASVLNELHEVEGVFKHNESIEVRVACKVNSWVRGAEVRMIIRDSRNINVFTSDVELDEISSDTDRFTASFVIPQHLLRPNGYYVTLALFVPHQYYVELLQDILFFKVVDGGTKYAQSEDVDYGPIFSPCETKIFDIITK